MLATVGIFCLIFGTLTLIDGRGGVRRRGRSLARPHAGHAEDVGAVGHPLAVQLVGGLDQAEQELAAEVGRVLGGLAVSAAAWRLRDLPVMLWRSLRM